MLRPPLDTEQALDLVLALPAHVSEMEDHRRFAQLLIDEYFVKLRARHEADETAMLYLDNLMAAVASAVRGFSIELRTARQRWAALEGVREARLGTARRLTLYSPLHESGWYGRLLGSIGGAGAFGIVAHLATTSRWVWLFAVLLGIFVGVVTLDFLLQRLSATQLSRAEAISPEERQSTWLAQSIPQYRLILRNFLITAIKLREEFYPSLGTIKGRRVFGPNGPAHIGFVSDAQDEVDVGEFDRFLDDIIDRHMAYPPLRSETNSHVLNAAVPSQEGRAAEVREG